MQESILLHLGALLKNRFLSNSADIFEKKKTNILTKESGHLFRASVISKPMGTLDKRGASPPFSYDTLVVNVGSAVKRFREIISFSGHRVYAEYFLAYHRIWRLRILAISF